MSSKAPKTSNGLLVLSKESKKLRAKAPLVNAWGKLTTAAVEVTTSSLEPAPVAPVVVEISAAVEDPVVVAVEERAKEELKSTAPAWDEYGGRGTSAGRIVDTSSEPTGPTNLQQLEYAAREPVTNQARKLFDPNTGTLVEFKRGGKQQQQRVGRGNSRAAAGGRPTTSSGRRSGNHGTSRSGPSSSNRSGPPPSNRSGAPSNRPRAANPSTNKPPAERKPKPTAPNPPPAPVTEQPVEATASANQQDTIQLDLNALVNNTSTSSNHIFAFGSNSTWGTPATADWGSSNNNKPDEDWNKWMGS